MKIDLRVIKLLNQNSGVRNSAILVYSFLVQNIYILP